MSSCNSQRAHNKRFMRLTKGYCNLQVRSNLQRAMGRPVALEEVQNITIAGIKAIEGIDAEATPAAADDTATTEREVASPIEMAAPLIEPAKIVDVTRDLPTSLHIKAPGIIQATYPAPAKKEEAEAEEAEAEEAQASEAVEGCLARSASLKGPKTPDREHSDQQLCKRLADATMEKLVSPNPNKCC